LSCFTHSIPAFPAQIDLLFAHPGLVTSIVALLKSDSIRALTGALRTVGNIITGTDEQTTAILEFGILDDLVGFASLNITFLLIFANSSEYSGQLECASSVTGVPLDSEQHCGRHTRTCGQSVPFGHCIILFLLAFSSSQTRLFSVQGLYESIFRLCQDPSPRKRKVKNRP
jgi:hypothetical protein